MRFVFSAFTLMVSLGLAFIVAAIGSYFTFGAVVSWYPTLVPPPLTPPSWIFAPVWTLLYTLMAVAAWRVYEKRREQNVHSVLSVYAVHLLINASWSFAFFGAENILVALGILVVLVALVFSLMKMFGRIDRIAGWLFVPYLTWVSFALYLNVGFALLN
jgi:translocator protein